MLRTARGAVALVVVVALLAGCSATVGPSSPTATDTGETATPADRCRADRPTLDAPNRSADWPRPPGALNGSTAVEYAVALERTFVRVNETTSSTLARTEVANRSAERVDDGWRVRLDATKWLQPLYSPDEPKALPGRRPYSATYLVTADAVRRVAHDRTATPTLADLADGRVVACLGTASP